MKSMIRGVLNRIGIDLIRYPTPLMKAMSQILNVNNFNVVLDVGANDGFYSMELRKLGYSKKIISFEPLLDSFQVLSKYASNSKWEHEVLHTALGEFDGKTSIHVSLNSVSSSILEATALLGEAAPKAKYYRTEEIEICKLDSIFRKYCNPDKDKIFLKMDVQGYEKNVLLGASDSIKYIDGIQLEVALVELYTNELLFREMLPYVEGLGFELCLLLPGFHDQETGRLLEVDCVFLRK